MPANLREYIGHMGDTEGFYESKKEDLIFNTKVTPENAHTFFPIRYGVELEYEGDVDVDEFYDSAEIMGLEVSDVKRDGSLSEGGVEIISKPLDSPEKLCNFMEGSLDVAKAYGMDNASPSAIHIHISNYPNPVELYYLVNKFVNVFEHLRKTNKNSLMHHKLLKPTTLNVKRSLRDVPKYTSYGESSMNNWINKGIDPVIDRKNSIASAHFMNSRRCTLRWTGYDSSNHTLEFRIFPQRMDYHVYESYVKIVTKLMEYASKNSLMRCRSSVNGGLYGALVEFQKVCELTKTEMYRLFHRKTSTSMWKVRDGMPLFVVYNCPEPLTPINLELKNPIIGELLRYEITNLNRRHCTFNLYKGHERIGMHTIGIGVEEYGGEDYERLKQHVEDGGFLTMYPDEETPNTPFYIPKSLVTDIIGTRVYVMGFATHEYKDSGILLTIEQLNGLYDVWGMERIIPRDFGATRDAIDRRISSGRVETWVPRSSGSPSDLIRRMGLEMGLDDWLE